MDHLGSSGGVYVGLATATLSRPIELSRFRFVLRPGSFTFTFASAFRNSYCFIDKADERYYSCLGRYCPQRSRGH